MRTRAVRDGDEYVITGAKAWTTHGGKADFYTVMARTSDDKGRGISCFLVPADSPGLTADHPEDKMGLMGSTTATMLFDGVRVPAERRLGGEGQGLPIALAGLDLGRPGIAAMATGVAQGALEVAVRYARGSGKRSASPSSTIRAWHSCSPTWPPRLSPHALRISTPRAFGTPTGPSPGKRPSRSWSLPVTL